MTTKERATYSSMETSTQEDWDIIKQFAGQRRERVYDSLMNMLKQMEFSDDGGPVNGLEHSLQSATRAYEDGADEETVFVALFHDVGQIVSQDNHSEVAAAILRPYISKKNHWIVQHHGEFQGYYFWHMTGKDRYAREKYKDSPYYQDCIDWCYKYDQNAFAQDYPTRPLEFFEPIVKRVMSRKPWEAYEAN